MIYYDNIFYFLPWADYRQEFFREMLYSLDIFLNSSELEKLSSIFESVTNLGCDLEQFTFHVSSSTHTFCGEQAIKISKGWLACINSQMK